MFERKAAWIVLLSIFLCLILFKNVLTLFLLLWVQGMVAHGLGMPIQILTRTLYRFKALLIVLFLLKAVLGAEGVLLIPGFPLSPTEKSLEDAFRFLFRIGNAFRAQCIRHIYLNARRL